MFIESSFLVSPNPLAPTIININSSINERHISFAKNTENDSNESNHTAIAMNDDELEAIPGLLLKR